MAATMLGMGPGPPVQQPVLEPILLWYCPKGCRGLRMQSVGTPLTQTNCLYTTLHCTDLDLSPLPFPPPLGPLS
eukprot:10045075-Heterocapsa_arctica.AAC.1